jgi:transposase
VADSWHLLRNLSEALQYPSDVTDEEWAFVLPYLLLCHEDSPQRSYELRTVFDAARYVARTGGQWRFLPHDLPPCYVVYQQIQRWLRAGCFEMLVEDVRSAAARVGRAQEPTHGGRDRQPHPAIDAGIGSAGGL